jgi:signal transduction histidine kinase
LALLLSESDETLEETQVYLSQHIKANMRRLSTMIDDLVKILQLNTGIFDFQYTAVDVITLVEDTITQVANQLREKDLSVNLALDDVTPHIYGDADSIRHIFEYMLTNAYLASSVGSEIAIQVGVEQVSLLSELSLEDVVLISVRDYGDGVSDDTGAGMLITKLFTEAHGGRMWFEPDEGEGSVFKVALPIRLMVDEES